jgi:hypothetical protein
MAPHEGEDDPEVYKASNSKSKSSSKPAKEPTTKTDDPKGKSKAKAEPESEDEDESESEDADDTLLTVSPSFNHLVIALRDAGVLKFVKYVSAAAPVSRWDISGEWEVAMLEEDDQSEVDDT